MSDFQAWYDNADMPTKGSDGKWYDLEDGLAYDPGYTYAPKHVKKLSQKALDNRKKAAVFGGKALKGTRKQKEWAEKIRAEFLEKFDFDAAEIACFLDMFKSAKFWIENRHASVTELEKKITLAAELIKKNNTLVREINAKLIVCENDPRFGLKIPSDLQAIINTQKSISAQIDSLFR